MAREVIGTIKKIAMQFMSHSNPSSPLPPSLSVSSSSSFSSHKLSRRVYPSRHVVQLVIDVQLSHPLGQSNHEIPSLYVREPTGQMQSEPTSTRSP